MGKLDEVLRVCQKIVPILFNIIDVFIKNIRTKSIANNLIITLG
jgi:hypothetical protein